MKPFSIAISFLLVACGAPEPARLDPAQFDHFGAGVAGSASSVAAAEVVAAPDRYQGSEVRVEGVIAEVCQQKGCWMNVGDRAQPLFVKFKDYGFFVPKDSPGRKVVMVGEVKVQTQSVEEARHYLEDAGKHEEAKKITAPVQKVTFIASGVAIAR